MKVIKFAMDKNEMKNILFNFQLISLKIKNFYEFSTTVDFLDFYRL
jgi:hypothetical protein